MVAQIFINYEVLTSATNTWQTPHQPLALAPCSSRSPFPWPRKGEWCSDDITSAASALHGVGSSANSPEVTLLSSLWLLQQPVMIPLSSWLRELLFDLLIDFLTDWLAVGFDRGFIIQFVNGCVHSQLIHKADVRNNAQHLTLCKAWHILNAKLELSLELKHHPLNYTYQSGREA